MQARAVPPISILLRDYLPRQALTWDGAYNHSYPRQAIIAIVHKERARNDAATGTFMDKSRHGRMRGQ